MNNNLEPNNEFKRNIVSEGNINRASKYFRSYLQQRDIEVEHPSPNTVESSVNLRRRRLPQAVLSQSNDEQNKTEADQDAEKTENSPLHVNARKFADLRQIESISNPSSPCIDVSSMDIPIKNDPSILETLSQCSDLQNIVNTNQEGTKKETLSLDESLQNLIKDDRILKLLTKNTKKFHVMAVLRNVLKRRYKNSHHVDMTSRILKRFEEKIFIEDDFLSSNSSKFLKEILINFSLSRQNIKSVSTLLAEVLKADTFLGIFSEGELYTIKEVKKQVDSLYSLIKDTQGRQGSASETKKIFNLWEETFYSFEVISPHLEHFFSEFGCKKDSVPSQLRARLIEFEDIYQFFRSYVFSDLEDTTTKDLSKILERNFATKIKDDAIFTSLPESVVTSVVAYTIKSIYRYNNDVLSEYMKQLSFNEFLDLLDKENRFLKRKDLIQGINGVSSTILLSSGRLKFSFKPLLFLQKEWFNKFDKLRTALTPVMTLLNEVKGKFKAFKSKNGNFVVLIKFPRAKDPYYYPNDISDDFYSRFSKAQQDEYENINISFPLKNEKDSSQTTNILFPSSCIGEGGSFYTDLREIGKLASLNNLQALSIENSDGLTPNCLSQDVLMFFRENSSSEAFIQIPRYFLGDNKIVESLASTFKFSKVTIKIPFLSGVIVMGGEEICHALSTLISDFEHETNFDLKKMELVCHMNPLSTECMIFDEKGNVILSATYDIKEKRFVAKFL